MSSIDANKPKARSGQRKSKAKQPGSKDDQRQRAKSNLELDEGDRVEAAVALNEAPPVEADASPERMEIEAVAVASELRTGGALVPVAPVPVAIAWPVETFWAGFQTITHAYGTYAWRSVEQTMDLVEKLTLARSLDKAVEVQNEFTKKACEGYLEDSQNIWRLHSEFTRRILRSFEHLAVWRTSAVR
jgi:hypothetical protein